MHTVTGGSWDEVRETVDCTSLIAGTSCLGPSGRRGLGGRTLLVHWMPRSVQYVQDVPSSGMWHFRRRELFLENLVSVCEEIT